MHRRLSVVGRLSPTFCLLSGHVCRWSILFHVRIFRRWHCTRLYYNYNRTSVRYALIMYCCAARSERNSSYRLCCSNGKRNCNTNATIGKQDLGEAVVCNRKHYGCVTAASRSILLAAHLSAFRVRRSYSKSCCTFQFLRVPVQETRLFARIPGCQLSRAVESRKHVR